MADSFGGVFCSRHNKTGYSSGGIAQEVLESIARNPRGPVYPKYFYRDDCGMFHLTSSRQDSLRRTPPKEPTRRGDNTRLPKFPQPEIDPDDDIFKPLQPKGLKLDYDI